MKKGKGLRVACVSFQRLEFRQDLAGYKQKTFQNHQPSVPNSDRTELKQLRCSFCPKTASIMPRMSKNCEKFEFVALQGARRIFVYARLVCGIKTVKPFWCVEIVSTDGEVYTYFIRQAFATNARVSVIVLGNIAAARFYRRY